LTFYESITIDGLVKSQIWTAK